MTRVLPAAEFEKMVDSAWEKGGQSGNSRDPQSLSGYLIADVIGPKSPVGGATVVVIISSDVPGVSWDTLPPEPPPRNQLEKYGLNWSAVYPGSDPPPSTT